MNDTKIVRFYVTHPGRLVGALGRNARQALLLRPDGLSNFEREAGRPPYAQTHAFEQWSLLHAHVYPRRFALLVFALGVGCAALIFLSRKQPGAAGRLYADFIALILAMAVIEFTVVTMVVGINDPIKHMFLVDVLVDATLLAAAAWAAGRLAARYGRWVNNPPMGLEAINRA